MTPHKEKEPWEAEFDNELKHYSEAVLYEEARGHEPDAGTVRQLKQFIRLLLLSQKEKLARVVENLKRKLPEKPCINAESRMFGECFNCMETNGRNNGLTDAASAIRNNKC